MDKPSFLSWLPKTPSKGFKYTNHHFKAIAARLDAVTFKQIDRFRCHMPPRHGKSETITIRYAIYRLIHDPGIRILITGYNQAFARKMSRRIRNMAQEMGVVLTADKKASDEWYTEDGSLVMARGVGSPPTGEGFDLIIIDDPICKREQAESPVERDKIWDWYTDDLYSRLQPGGAIVAVFTRWHEDDLGGRLDDAEANGGDKWVKLILKAISDTGDALWPEYRNVDALQRIRRAMVKKDGDRSWEALFQQNPTPKQGGLFDVLALRYCEPSEVPKYLPKVRAWDVAYTADGGDDTVGLLMEGPDAEGIYYLSDIDMFQLGPAQRDTRMMATAAMDGVDVEISLPRDPAAGAAQMIDWRKKLAHYTIVEAKPTQKKSVRWGPFASAMGAGLICLVRANWNTAFVEEARIARESGNKKDNQLDAAADAYLRLTEPTFDYEYTRF